MTAPGTPSSASTPALPLVDPASPRHVEHEASPCVRNRLLLQQAPFGLIQQPFGAVQEVPKRNRPGLAGLRLTQSRKVLLAQPEVFAQARPIAPVLVGGTDRGESFLQHLSPIVNLTPAGQVMGVSNLMTELHHRPRRVKSRRTSVGHSTGIFITFESQRPCRGALS